MSEVKLNVSKINELPVGEIKYKELINTLEMENKRAGNPRNAQLKELRQYMDIEHIKASKFIIHKKYDTPKEKIDNRKGNSGKSEGSRGNNNGIYGKYIDPILTEYFQYCIKNEKYVIWETVNMLAERVGIINWNFRTANSNKYEFKLLINKENNTKMTNRPFYNVFYKINEIKRKPIISSLDRLQEKKLIKYEMNYIIYYKHENRLPKIGEDEIIEECVKIAKEKFNIESAKEVMNDEKIKNEYYEYVNELVKEQIEECDGIFQGFKIIINEKILNEKVDNIKQSKEKLNKIIIKKVKDYLYKNKEKIKREYAPTWGICKPSDKKYIREILDINYIPYTDIVIHYLLDLKANNIVYKIAIIKNENNRKKKIREQEIKDNQGLARELIDAGFYPELKESDLPY